MGLVHKSTEERKAERIAPRHTCNDPALIELSGHLLILNEAEDELIWIQTRQSEG